MPFNSRNPEDAKGPQEVKEYKQVIIANADMSRLEVTEELERNKNIK